VSIIRKFAAQTSRLHGALSYNVNQRREKLILALAMAGMATQVYAVFAVVVALGGGGHPPALRTHFYRPRAPQRPCAVGAQPFGLDSELDFGKGRAKAH
jgi:hypothetical protein